MKQIITKDIANKIDSLTDRTSSYLDKKQQLDEAKQAYIDRHRELSSSDFRRLTLLENNELDILKQNIDEAKKQWQMYNQEFERDTTITADMKAIVESVASNANDLLSTDKDINKAQQKIDEAFKELAAAYQEYCKLVDNKKKDIYNEINNSNYNQLLNIQQNLVPHVNIVPRINTKNTKTTIGQQRIDMRDHKEKAIYLDGATADRLSKEINTFYKETSVPLTYPHQ